MAKKVCPYVGRVGDPETFYLEPHASHRCQAVAPAEAIELEHQASFCYGKFEKCPRFLPLDERGRRSEPVPREPVVGEDSAPDPADAYEAAAAAAARAPEPDLVDRARAWARGLSFEEWLVYGGAAAIILLVVWTVTVGRMQGGPRRGPEPGVQQRAQDLLATRTPTAPPRATNTRGPTRDAPPPATVPPRTPPAGGLIAAISPSESGSASFNARDRVATTGGRQLLVGNLAGIEYAGGLLFPLARIPANARIEFAALELMGWDDADLAEEGEWTVELLSSEAAVAFPNMTYETLVEAQAASVPIWRIPASELSVSKANVLELDDAQLAYLRQQMSAGNMAVRLRGPNIGDPESLFAWDSGYGEGFGIRPVLRVGFVPPPVTARPRQGEATPEPLLIPVVDPTAAPSATALPAGLPGDFSGRILFLSDLGGRSALFLMDPDTRALWRVTQSWPYLVAKRAESNRSGVTAATGSRPCGGSQAVDEAGDPIPGSADPVRTCAQILVSQQDGPMVEITEPGWLHYDPAVSPDGQWIAYVSNVTGNDEIFKIRSDGTENTRLTENLWEWDKHPSWSPDGSRIVFWSNREGHPQLYVMNADGTNVTNLSAGAQADTDPVWVK